MKMRKRKHVVREKPQFPQVNWMAGAFLDYKYTALQDIQEKIDRIVDILKTMDIDGELVKDDLLGTWGVDV